MQDQGEEAAGRSLEEWSYNVWSSPALSVQVVPLALVCLLTGCLVLEAESRLEQRPVVREAVEACLS